MSIIASVSNKPLNEAVLDKHEKSIRKIYEKDLKKNDLSPLDRFPDVIFELTCSFLEAKDIHQLRNAGSEFYRRIHKKEYQRRSSDNESDEKSTIRFSEKVPDRKRRKRQYIDFFSLLCRKYGFSPSYSVIKQALKEGSKHSEYLEPYLKEASIRKLNGFLLEGYQNYLKQGNPRKKALFSTKRVREFSKWFLPLSEKEKSLFSGVIVPPNTPRAILSKLPKDLASLTIYRKNAASSLADLANSFRSLQVIKIVDLDSASRGWRLGFKQLANRLSNTLTELVIVTKNAALVTARLDNLAEMQLKKFRFYYCNRRVEADFSPALETIIEQSRNSLEEISLAGIEGTLETFRLEGISLPKLRRALVCVKGNVLALIAMALIAHESLEEIYSPSIATFTDQEMTNTIFPKLTVTKALGNLNGVAFSGKKVEKWENPMSDIAPELKLITEKN